jgi:hypothetical protein
MAAFARAFLLVECLKLAESISWTSRNASRRWNPDLQRLISLYERVADIEIRKVQRLRFEGMLLVSHCYESARPNPDRLANGDRGRAKVEERTSTCVHLQERFAPPHRSPSFPIKMYC